MEVKISNKNKSKTNLKMTRQIELRQIFAAISVLAFVTSSSLAQDYDGGETETAITGLGGLGGLSGLTGFGGLSALANGVVTGYAPMGASSDVGQQEGIYQGGQGERGLAAEGSEAETGDYDEDSNDSSASEEHPILSKFFNLISGGRHKRSVEMGEPMNSQAASASQVHSRVKRGYKGWVPYVSTYVKTDKKANFKWGVSRLYQL